MRPVGIVLTAMVALALPSPSAVHAQTRFPEMDHLPSGQSEAYTHLRTGLSFKKKAEKAHRDGRAEDEKKYLEGARFHLRQALDAQEPPGARLAVGEVEVLESPAARLALGEVEVLLGNAKEGWTQCRQALALKGIEEKDRQRAEACVQDAVHLDPSLEQHANGS